MLQTDWTNVMREGGGRNFKRFHHIQETGLFLLNTDNFGTSGLKADAVYTITHVLYGNNRRHCTRFKQLWRRSTPDTRTEYRMAKKDTSFIPEQTVRGSLQGQWTALRRMQETNCGNCSTNVHHSAQSVIANIWLYCYSNTFRPQVVIFRETIVTRHKKLRNYTPCILKLRESLGILSRCQKN
jgi:hypothetical protein